MTSGRVWVVVREAELAGDGAARVVHVCAMAADSLGVDVVGPSVTSGPGRHTRVAAADQVSGRIEDLQLLLGQVDRVLASFALPLLVEEVRLGAMDLYRRDTGPLADGDIAAAQDFATAAVEVLLRLQDAAPDEARERLEPGWEATSQLHQATGMAMVQLDVDGPSAFAALRARAHREGRSLQDVARDVLERRIRLDDRGR